MTELLHTVLPIVGLVLGFALGRHTAALDIERLRRRLAHERRLRRRSELAYQRATANHAAHPANPTWAPRALRAVRGGR